MRRILTSCRTFHRCSSLWSQACHSYERQSMLGLGLQRQERIALFSSCHTLTHNKEVGVIG